MSVHTVWLTGGGANVQLLIGKSLSMKVVILNYLNHNTPPIVDEKSFITVHKPWYVLDPIEVNLNNNISLKPFLNI